MSIQRCGFMVLLCLTALGCRKEEAIEQYEATHPGREKIRLLAAIFPRPDLVWFFYLAGPADAVASEKEAFEQLIHSVRFSDKQDEEPITWRPAANWMEEGQSEMRYRTFRVKTKGVELETTVTPLGPGAGNILSNVNRWRKKINLAPLEPDDLRKDTAEITRHKVGDADVWMIDMEGSGVHRVGKPGRAPEPIAKHPPALEQPAANSLPFTLTPPKNWQPETPPAPLSSESFTVEGTKIRVTLTPLGGGGGKLMDNINRWRKQVGLGPTSEAELAQTAQKLSLDGLPALFVDINNPQANRIVGVMMPHEGTTWFFKMTGPSEAVGQHKAEFEAYAKSLKLTKGQ